LLLLGLYLVWWTVMAIEPKYRDDWLIENVLVFISVPALIWGYRRLRFSNFCYTLLFFFFCFHTLGSHYTYSEVPYAQWLGWDLEGRNHYDRLVHFLFGLLIIPVVIELFEVKAALKGVWRHIVPVTFIMAHSELYEIIEWQAAEVFGGDLGQAFLGTQGDVWDAQKDSLLAALGAVSGMGSYRLYEWITRRQARAG